MIANLLFFLSVAMFYDIMHAGAEPDAGLTEK